jgi:hypothetical protein
MFTALILFFSVIFLLNVIPAFAPPTWMIFSFIGFHFPAQNGAELAIESMCALHRAAASTSRWQWARRFPSSR